MKMVISKEEGHLRILQEFDKKDVFRRCLLVLGILTCAYKGVRNVSFSENLAYVPDGWSLTYQSKLLVLTKFYFHFFFHFEVPKKILVFFEK